MTSQQKHIANFAYAGLSDEAKTPGILSALHTVADALPPIPEPLQQERADMLARCLRNLIERCHLDGGKAALADMAATIEKSFPVAGAPLVEGEACRAVIDDAAGDHWHSTGA